MSASAGTFISAALGTAGQFYQSYAIDLLTYPLVGLIVLAFVAGALQVLGVVVFQGGFRGGLLLLLGPCLLLVAIFYRTEPPAVEWTGARSADEQNTVRETAAGISTESAYKRRVSALFSGYDYLVSSFVRQTSKALRDSDQAMDVPMVMKSQLLGFLMAPEVSDPGLKELLHLSLLGECRAMIRAGQEMADVRNRPAERCEWAKGYSELAGQTTLKLSPNAAKYVAALNVDLPMLLDVPVVDDLGTELAKLKSELAAAKPQVACPLDGAVGSPPDSASQLAEQAIQQNAFVRNQIMRNVGGTTAGLPRTSDSVEALDRYFQERQEKIEARSQELSAESYSCHEIWNIAYAAIHYEAAMSLETVKAQGEERGFDPEELIADLAAMSGVEDKQELIRAIARKLFRLENIKGSSAALIQEFARRGPDIRHIDVMDTDDMEANLRHDTQEAEWSGQSSMIQTAYMLPYYQGLILFFLSLAFPFFALLLAVPGRALGFFIWFGLWFWVKSWDIGYALVSMIDRALFSIFVVRMDSGYVNSRTMLDLDFSAAVSALRDVDPTFDVGTYYNIVAVCLVAVPLVSAQLTVQVASGLASVVRGQLQTVQANATLHARALTEERAIGSLPAQDIRATLAGAVNKTLSNPLSQRASTSVTVIDETVGPAVYPREPNLIATGVRQPAVLSLGRQNQATSTGARNLLPRAQVSRWDLVDITTEPDPEAEVIDSEGQPTALSRTELKRE